MGRNKENINYLGKIVISGGRKAKVVNEIQNELEIVFQENGKYQGNVATVKKGEVALLDKRKNPEKYPLSEVEKKIEEKLQNLQEIPSNMWSFELLKTYIKKAKSIGTDVSKYEAMLPKITKKYYLATIEEELKMLHENPKDRVCLELCVSHFQTAIETWIDVSKYTERFQQCLVKSREARVGMGFIRNYPEVDKFYRQAMKPIEDKFVFGS